MIIGLGLDLVNTYRIERELACGAWTPADGVFTAGELLRCCSSADPAVWMATCFAVKEAALKALGTEVCDTGRFREVELVFRDGYAEVELHDELKEESQKMGVRRIKVAVALGKKNAGAIVVLEA